MENPNILFIVWDACRYDQAVENASYLTELASSNIWFENAIAPSPWSLPSHASMFSGKYPHEHGQYRLSDSVDTPLVSTLSDRDYTTYGVSANGFASQRTGFDENFDEFRYTGGRDPYLDGIDVSGTAQKILREENGSYQKALFEVLRRVPGSSNKLKSISNLLAVSGGKIASKIKTLQTIPHPVFAPTSDYSYSPKKNTRAIRSIITEHDRSEPFFIFSNYMDTHRCYKPDAQLQNKYLDRTLSYRELVHLNEEIAAPWPFEEKKSRNELSDHDVEEVRGLYSGEVETVDSHLERIYNILKSEDLLEDTVIVITADHGENLGELDEIGRKRMGHEASVSNSVLNVPLLISHPDLREQRISAPVSLINLYDLFLNFSVNNQISNHTVLDPLETDQVVSQYPAKGGAKETSSQYPDVPTHIIEHACSENSVVGYENGWTVVVESTRKEWAEHDGRERTPSEAPTHLLGLVRDHLSALHQDNQKASLTTEDVEQLEALGYM